MVWGVGRGDLFLTFSKFSTCVSGSARGMRQCSRRILTRGKGNREIPSWLPNENWQKLTMTRLYVGNSMKETYFCARLGRQIKSWPTSQFGSPGRPALMGAISYDQVLPSAGPVILWENRMRAGASPHSISVDVDPRAGFSQNIPHVDVSSGELTHMQPVLMGQAWRFLISIPQASHSWACSMFYIPVLIPKCINFYSFAFSK